MYRAVTDIGEVRKYLSSAPVVAFDFETAPDDAYRSEGRAALDPHKAHIVGVSFSVTGGDGIYVPVSHRGCGNCSLMRLLPLLADFAADTSTVKVAHNIAFESMFLYRLGVVLQAPVYDTIAASQLTFLGEDGFRQLSDSGLKTLVPEVFGEALPSFGAVTGGRHFDELDPADSETVRYACADSDYALRLYHYFNGWFAEWAPKHRFVTETIESPSAVYSGIMKYNGLKPDTALMGRKAAECDAMSRKLREDIRFIIGDVDVGTNGATNEFKHYLYKEMKLPVFKTGTENKAAADEEALILLTDWCAENRPELVPLFKLVLEYRHWNKIRSTYIGGYNKHVNSATGRIHADLLPLATKTGRFASRNPNLQNMPRAGKDEIGVRNFFAAPEGCVLLSLDFSQIELRVGAFYCRDCKMLETYRVGGDIHDETATVLYGPGKHDKEQRTIAKSVNFGTFYGLMEMGLKRGLKKDAGLDVDLKECKKIMDTLMVGYPMLAVWQDATKRKAAEDKYTETWLGRRRRLPDITSDIKGKRSYAERCALNTPIQGTAADILKLALCRILPGLPERPWLRPVLQVHDELVFEIPASRTVEAVAFVKACMEACPFDGFDVPIIADAAFGTRFGEMAEII